MIRYPECYVLFAGATREQKSLPWRTLERDLAGIPEDELPGGDRELPEEESIENPEDSKQ